MRLHACVVMNSAGRACVRACVRRPHHTVLRLLLRSYFNFEFLGKSTGGMEPVSAGYSSVATELEAYEHSLGALLLSGRVHSSSYGVGRGGDEVARFGDADEITHMMEMPTLGDVHHGPPLPSRPAPRSRAISNTSTTWAVGDETVRSVVDMIWTTRLYCALRRALIRSYISVKSANMLHFYDDVGGSSSRWGVQLDTIPSVPV
jgi:hypothetical protein